MIVKSILFYSDKQVLPDRGGTERVTCILGSYFISKGFRVFFCSRDKISDEKSVAETFYLPSSDYGTEENVDFIKNLVREKSIDIIINQSCNGYSFKLFGKSALGNDIKIISVLHFSVYEGLNYFLELLPLEFSILSVRDTCISLYKILKSPLNKLRALSNKRVRFISLINESDKVVLLSKRYIEDILKITKFTSAANKLVSIPNPKTFASVQDDILLNEKDKEILFVGRLSFSDKRVDRILKVWKNLYLQYPLWSLRIVGDGPDRGRLETLSKKWKLERIYFEGIQNSQKFYERASIFLLSSTHEGLPMVLIEAMEHGVVPVCFDSFGAAQDLIQNGVNGYLIKPFDIKAYSECVSELVSNEEKRFEMAKSAYISSENYEMQTIGDRWLNLFKEL
ncbi:glycosyltransferase [Coprobacter sp.]